MPPIGSAPTFHALDEVCVVEGPYVAHDRRYHRVGLHSSSAVSGGTSIRPSAPHFCRRQLHPVFKKALVMVGEAGQDDLGNGAEPHPQAQDLGHTVHAAAKGRRKVEHAF